MRIIASFIFGGMLLFYLTEFGRRFGSKLGLTCQNLPFPYSFIGLVIFLGAFFYGLVSRPDPMQFLLSLFIAGAGLGIIAHHFLSQSFLFFRQIETKWASRHQKGIERFIEIIPGALTWLAITSPLWLSYTLPYAVAYLIIIADIYWFITALRISILIYVGYRKMEYVKKVDWVKSLDSDFKGEWQDYYQLLVLPTYKESLEVLTPAFDAIANSAYPKKHIFLAVGFEEREQQKNPEKIQQTIDYLNSKVSPKIGGVFATIHPFGLPGEVPGPGSNRNFMIKNAASSFEKLGISADKVFVTTLDADFVIHHQFLSGVLHKYLSTPAQERNKRSFTGAFLYYNNYWQAPTVMRIIAAGTAYWQLSEMVGSDKYINFSSLSINLQSLLDVGLWIPDKVNDDSGFYWKAYYHFNGDYKVIPHYLPIYADAVLDVTLLKTFQNQYLQFKRWAYGVEHIPFIITQYFTQKNMDFWDKTDKLFFILWSYFKWGTIALFITFASFLIPIVNPSYAHSAVAYNLPIISSYILTGAFIGLFTTIYVHEKTVPKRPASWSKLQKFWSVIQWALVPLVIVTITVIPAIDAQTTLMLGRYMEFRVTTKARTNLKS